MKGEGGTERKRPGRYIDGEMMQNYTIALLMPSSPVNVHAPQGQKCEVHSDHGATKPFMHKDNS